MNNSEQRPKFFKTLFNDFRQLLTDIFNGSFIRNIRKDYRDIQAFFLEQERRERLERMNWFRRFFYAVFWLFQILFFKLSSVRRVLLIIGLVLLFSSKNGQNADNSIILAGLLFLFILMLELKDKMIARTELEAGRSVQKALAPLQSPEIPGWDTWLFTRSANDVGGDLIDFIHIYEKRYTIAVGDVAGKGLAAALFMAKLQAVLRAIAPDYESLTGLFEKLNQIFHRDSLPNSFASLVCLEPSPSSSELKLVNAGHMPPLLIQNDSLKELDKGEPALGLMPATRYKEIHLKLVAGDVIIVYSDGITEALNEEEEFYGEDRLKQLLFRNRNLTAQKLGKLIVNDVDAFIGSARATDDLSIAVIRKL